MAQQEHVRRYQQHILVDRGCRDELLGDRAGISATSVDGLQFGAGLEGMASVMHKGTLLKTLCHETKFGAVT